ncbi:MAG TPA: ABC transporter substrate-binding protein [Candidatus Binatia bacterium]|nr:ABC transporter substrate-binding protein [Candidatus Binatia bacterium]
MRGIVFFCVAIAMLAFLGSPARGQAPFVVKVGILTSTTDTPLFIADKKGYFRDEGLSVNFITFDSGANMIAPLGTGQLDVGGGALSVGLYNAVARGIDVRVVADLGSDPPGYGLAPFLVRADLVKSGRYKTLADLKGMTVAGNSPQSSGAVMMSLLVKKAGLTPSDIKVAYLAYPEQVVALKNASVDAAISLEPFATEAVESGAAVRIMGDDEFYPNQEISVIMYGGSFIKNHRDLGLKFMRAYLKAVRYYNGALAHGRLAGPNADDVIKILLDSMPIKDASIFRKLTPSGDNPNGHAYLASMRFDFAFFKAQGLIQGTVKPEDVVDDSFVTEVLRTMGPYKPPR